MWHIELFGGPTASCDGRALDLIGRPAGALLALLALDSGRPQSRESLIDTLWPEIDPESARNRFKQTLAVLRRALEPDGIPPDSVLVADRRTVLLRAEHTVDVAGFQGALRTAARARTDDERIDALKGFLTLGERPLCPGLYADPILAERERLASRRAQSLLALGKLHAARGEFDDARAALDALLRTDPENDDARARLESLKTRPTIAAVGIATVGIALAIAPDTIAVSPVSAATPPANRFLGRESELALIDGLFSDGARLVTLTGYGGAGKTRLSQEFLALANTRNPEHPTAFAATAFVALENTRDANTIGDSVCAALGVPHGPKPPAERLAAFLADRPALVILDNLEQLSPDDAASNIDSLLRAAPSLTVLATSRTRLELAAEHVVSLDPLPVPDLPATPERLAEFASVALFVDRAKHLSPRFALNSSNAETVAALCRQLDGLPLAIELAAARIEILSPQQICERLSRQSKSLDLLADRRHDRAERQRSLRAALAWSTRLLAPDTTRFFSRLGVFSGGFALDDAAAVTGDENALEQVQTLCDASLLRADVTAGDTRFRLLETVRAFALEQLDASGDRAKLDERHARHFAAIVIENRPRLKTADTLALARIDADRENIDDAIPVLCLADASTALKLCASLGQFWQIRGLLGQGRETIARTLAATARAEVSPAIRADVWTVAGVLAYRQGDHGAARSHNETALGFWDDAGDPAGRARTLGNLAAVVALTEPDRALALYEDAITTFRGVGDRRGEALLLYSTGWLMHRQKRYDDARAWHERAIPLLREIGDRFNEAMALGNLGDTLMRLGARAESAKTYRECLFVAHSVGARQGCAMVLASLADIELENGAPETAAKLGGAWEGWCERNGVAFDSPDRARRLALLEDRLGPDEARRLHHEARGMSLDEAVALALARTAAAATPRDVPAT